jgi:RNA polymerase sigma factor (sigma-70 family)
MTEIRWQVIEGGAGIQSGEAGTAAAPKPPGRAEQEDKFEFIEHLFRRYRHSLQKYLNRLTRNREESDEVIQETYLRLIQTDQLDRLEARARNYIFTIATNLVRDRRRYDLSRSKDRHDSIDDAELACHLPMPEYIVDRDKGLEIVRRCLLELQPRCRQVFILHALEQLTFTEIAVVLKISRKTVVRDFGLALELCQLRLRDISP